MLTDELAIALSTNRGDEGILIERAGVREEPWGDPRLERQPASEVHAMKYACRHVCLFLFQSAQTVA